MAYSIKDQVAIRPKPFIPGCGFDYEFQGGRIRIRIKQCRMSQPPAARAAALHYFLVSYRSVRRESDREHYVGFTGLRTVVCWRGRSHARDGHRRAVRIYSFVKQPGGLWPERRVLVQPVVSSSEICCRRLAVLPCEVAEQVRGASMAILISPAEAHRERERALGVLIDETSLGPAPESIQCPPLKSASSQELPALGEHRPAPRRAQSEFLGAGKR